MRANVGKAVALFDNDAVAANATHVDLGSAQNRECTIRIWYDRVACGANGL